MEVGSLLSVNDINNVIDDKVLSYFKCLSSLFEVYIARFRTKLQSANVDFLKISVYIFFDKTYLQKPHCVMIENIAAVNICLKSKA